MYHVYQPGWSRGCHHLLNRIYAHLDKPGSPVRVTFFDFSSAFNTDQPLRLAEELSVCQTAKLLVYIVMSNSNTPQGTVPLQFMLTLYIFCFNSGTFHLQKFSNDF